MTELFVVWYLIFLFECFVNVVVAFGCCHSDDDSMDVDASHAAANMACVLNFIKKMLAIVSLAFTVSLSQHP